MMQTSRKISLSAIMEGVQTFVELRRKETGGFAATPRLPATVEDTFHALRIITAISQVTGSPIAEKTRNWPELAAFLAGYLEREVDLGPRGFFQLLWSMKFCNIQPAPARLEGLILSSILGHKGRENIYFATRAASEAADSQTRSRILANMEDVRLPSPFSGILKFRMMDLFVDRMLCWNRISAENASSWIRACQNADGGFGFRPGTTSYIENCHYALSCLHILSAGPPDRQACWNFITGSLTKSGGFSRNSNAAPFLDATWHAIKSLLLLEKH